jgi:Ca2+-binding EF-hand superfamily protein
MGGKIVVPEADANIAKCVKNFHLTPKDISDYWKIFQKLDKEKTGLVPLQVIFKSFKCERNLITDCLLELVDVEHDGEINFSDFLFMVMTYCFFEPLEILKFCFYCFDQDKTGFFSIDDLNNLMNVVHNIKTGATVKGNVKASWMMLEFKADQLDFNEFSQIHNAFPRLFEPAFRLQQLMMIHTMGEMWWTLKKREVQDLKEEADFRIAKTKARKEARKREKKNRVIRRNMGVMKYYFCFCYRDYYDPANSHVAHLSAEEKLEREKQLKIMKRQAELKLKNPETADWLKYQKKIVSDMQQVENRQVETQTSIQQAKLPGSAAVTATLALVPLEEKQLPMSAEEQQRSYLEQKLATTTRPREDRAFNRAERKMQRKAAADNIPGRT